MQIHFWPTHSTRTLRSRRGRNTYRPATVAENLTSIAYTPLSNSTIELVDSNGVVVGTAPSDGLGDRSIVPTTTYDFDIDIVCPV